MATSEVPGRDIGPRQRHGWSIGRWSTPYGLPAELTTWWQLAAAAYAGVTVSQSPPPMLRSAHAGCDRWEDGPGIAAGTEYTLDQPATRWSRLRDGAATTTTTRRRGST